MEQRTRAYIACAAIVGIFLVVQLGALAMVEPFKSAGLQAVEDPQDPTNSLVYIGAILVATVFMLAAFRYDVDWAIRLLIVFSAGYISVVVLSVLLPPTIPLLGFDALALAGAAAVALGLLFYPEWWVIDGTGILMGVGAAGLFGISFGVLPALVLLTVLAVYDAISVYGTEHMLTLASGVMDLKIPVVLVVPLSLSYSFLDADNPVEEDEAGTTDEDAAANGGEEAVTDDADESGDATDDNEDEDAPMDRDALFIGLGDAVIPTVLVASAGFFAPSSVPSLGVPGLALTLPAATALVGTMVGLVVLLSLVLKGRAHAGLPLLNGGAIAGYLVGALASGLTLVEALGLGPYL